MLAFVVGLIVFLFVPSAYGKVTSFGENQASMLAASLPWIPETLAQLLVFAAGIMETLSLILIAYGILYQKKTLTKLGAIGLIVFTIAVTIVFGISPFDQSKVLRNSSTVGGLLLLVLHLK